MLVRFNQLQLTQPRLGARLEGPLSDAARRAPRGRPVRVLARAWAAKPPRSSLGRPGMVPDFGRSRWGLRLPLTE